MSEERTYPDLTDMIFELSKTREMNKRKFYIQLNLLRRDGVSLEEIATRYNLPLTELQEMTTGTRSNVKYTFSTQIKCPNCRGKIIVPPVTIRNDITEEITKESNCVHCHCNLEMVVNNQGEAARVTILLIPAILPKIYLDELKMVVHTGVALTTPIYFREGKNFEVRAGIAIFGNMNNPAANGACPFDPYFRDNHCQGYGENLAEAVVNFKANLESLSKSLF